MASIPFDPEIIPQIPQMIEEEQEPPFNPEIKNNSEDPIDQEEIPTAFKTLRDRAEESERPVREVLIRQWKMQQLFWQGIQRFYWDADVQDLRSINSLQDVPLDLPVDLNDYGKCVNIYRAYGQAIAGALTTGEPKVKFFPKDAEKITDILKAKGYSKLAELISIQNQMVNKLTQAVVIAYNQGFVAAYNYNHTSKRYGTATISNQVPIENAYQVGTCENCGQQAYENKLDYSDGAVLTDDETLNSPILGNCESCGPSNIANNVQIRPETQEVFEDKDKSRQIIEIYGPLNVKIPASAQSPEQVGWVNLERERHVAEMRCIYPEIADLIKGGAKNNQAYERWARANYETVGEYQQEYTTVNQIWFRPWAYYLLEDKDLIDELNEYYPEGAYVVFVNGVFAEVCPSNMDDHWTFAVNPLSNRLYCESWGRGMVDLQEMTNDLILLELETVKYGIPMIFADPEFFDFDSYRKSRAAPGSVYPLKQTPQAGVSSVFHETRAATLSKEVPELEARIKMMSDFISAAPPSIFGGPASGSKTLGEYEQSRNQALQVLSILWKVILYMYTGTMSKAVRGYHKSMLEDEKIVKANGDSFINILIRKSELDGGEVGEVYPETGEQFPTTWPQKRAMLLELIGLQNDYVNALLTHPENSYLIAQLLGLDDLYIPGDNQRDKQLYEIALLVTQVSPDGFNPSIPVEPLIDDSQVHSEVLKAYLTGEHGQDLKISNPAGYQNVVLHLQQHDMIVQEQMMAQQQAEQEQNNEKSNNLPVKNND